MNRLCAILGVLFVCIVVRGATPTFSDFDPTQFNLQPNLPPGSIKISLSVNPTNITINLFYTTNLFSTNITTETINNVSNFNLFSFITNLFVTQEYVSNLFVTNITVLGQGNGPWIAIQSGGGNNNFLTNLTVVDDFALVTTDPLAAPVFEMVSNNVILAGYDDSLNGWFGNGGGLTNLNVASLVGNFNTSQFRTNGSGKIEMTNTAGIAIMSVPFFTYPTTKTNGTIWTAQPIGANVPPLAAFTPLNVFWFQPPTNNTSTPAKAGFYIGANAATSDGSLALMIDRDIGNGNSSTLVPDNWWTNGAEADSIIIGVPPEWKQIGTNATGNPINWFILDSTVINAGGGMGLAKQIQFCTLQVANGGLLACTNLNSSTILGAVMSSMLASTNDTMLGTLGFNWNTYSSGNSFLSANQLNNSHSGNSNDLIGVGIDLPVDNTSFQANIKNAIWISGASAGGNSRTNATVAINSNLVVRALNTVGVVTNDAAGDVGTAFILPAVNLAATTNLPIAALVSPTNAVNSVTAIDFSRPEETTNITAAIAFTSLSNFNSTNYNNKIWHIINNSGGNLTLTVGTGWRTDPILRTTATTYTITNNTCTDLLVSAQINQFTNALVAIGSQ